ncbi:Protein FAM167A [Chionoecetes opilio]|uniref:Protein FAM167A n=1 Tax=Chionoecetes opilio TaxID=41210 RepID=A0A8J4XUD3_CHIOP|nr:Protein FAM167A [Chionoecetes opilio]
MSRLRDLTTRLQLTTRRPSYLDWAAVLKERGRRGGEALATHTPTVIETGEPEQEVEEELSMDRRKHNLQTAVDWVKKELTDMRQQDQQLARQLLQLRVEVQRLRLLHSCLATSCLLDEVASGAKEARLLEASDLCDLPPDLRETFSPVLREMGLTRMNITSRRFSLR